MAAVQTPAGPRPTGPRPAGTYPGSAFALAATERRARLTDPRRLAALDASGLTGGAGDEVLDRLARTASRLLGVPIALVSLVDGEGQHFAGLAGLGGWAGEGRGTPLSHSFCQYVVAGEDPLAVTDASAHPVLRDNGACRELGVVAYAGVPLRTSEGETLGSFCAIDLVPRAWTDEQIAGLRDLAASAMAEIELRAALRTVEAQRARIAESEARLAQALQAAQMAVWSYDVAEDVVTASPEWGPLFGLARGEVLPTVGAFVASIHPDDRPRVAAAIAAAQATRARYDVEFRVRHPDGTERWVHDVGEAHHDADGRAVRMSGLVRDVSDRKRADLAREAAEARFRGMLERVHAPVVCVDADGAVTFVNDALLDATGWTRAEVVGGDWFARFVPPRFAPDGAGPARARFRAALRDGTLAPRTERQLLARDGAERTVRWDNVVLRDADGRPVGAASIGQDVTDLRRVQTLLQEQAIRDELTGLLNRRGFGELAGRQLALAARTGTPCVLVNLDLDGFKAINDTFGHEAGDAALVEVAGLLTGTCRATDLVARLGGDEFVVLAVGGGADDVAAIRRRLREAFDAVNARPGRTFAVEASVGVARCDPGAPVSLAGLLRAADDAMYDDKRARRAGAGLKSGRRRDDTPGGRPAPGAAPSTSLHLSPSGDRMTVPPPSATAGTPLAPSADLDAQVDAALRDLARLQEVQDLGLPSAEVDTILQEEARAAAEHFGLPIGLVSIVLDDVQLFAAQHGLDDRLAEQGGTPVEWSFCRFAVATQEPFVVEDATRHALVADNPLVARGGIRCYAGIPLVSSRGHALGSFCVVGTEARHFDEAELADLRRRAARAVARIEARRAA